MHILVLPSWYPTKEDPVKGSFFAEQAAALARYGHTVTVMAVYNDGERGVQTEKRSDGNLTEYLIHVKPLRFHLTYFRILREMLVLLRQCGKPDVIHVHSYGAAKYAAVLRLFSGVPYVITEHVSWFARGTMTKHALREAALAYRKANGVLAVSPGLRETIAPLCGGKKIQVLPNLVNEAFFARTRKDIPARPFRFISVGWLEKNKGMDLLLEAFGRLIDSGADAHLTICGSGSEKEALEAQAKELSCAGRVTFTGAVPREKIGEYLAESHAFVLASRVETFGVAFVEAMACGLPIVMAKTAAWRMLALPETGLAVEVGDKDGLADAMASIMENYGAYDPDTIREICRGCFSEKAVCEQLTAVYESVVRR